jgi:retron-type reverse transcriptase
MKRYGNLYRKIYDFANLESAYRKARRNKRYRTEVLRYTANLEENLIDLQNHLIWKSYRQGQHRTFIVTEPKLRQIAALPFYDRVAQHAVNNIIEPLIDRRFYFHSYACRKGKGMHKASDMLTRWLRAMTHEDLPLYALKADVHSYFKSINHARLKEILRRAIKDGDVLWLLDTIIDSGGEGGRGVPIGNLTSQLFANIYLNELDKHVKEVLHERRYIRYMDDFLILSHDMAELRRVLEDIAAFLWSDLCLGLNPKTTIINAAHGVDFCGYRHWHDHKKIRRRSVRRMKAQIKAYRKGRITKDRLVRSLTSWQGHISHADTYHLKERVMAGLPPEIRKEFEDGDDSL